MPYTNRWSWQALSASALSSVVGLLNEAMAKLAQSYNTHGHGAADIAAGSLGSGDFAVTGVLAVSNTVAAGGNITVVGNISSGTGDLTLQDNVQVNGTLAVSGKIASSGGSVASGYFDNGNSGAAITIDWLKGNFQTLTLTANCTLTYSNVPKGLSFFLALVQDATGSRTVTHDANVFWSSGVAPTLTVTANKADAIEHVTGGAGILAKVYALNY